MPAVFPGNTTPCNDWTINANELNTALDNAEILSQGNLTLTRIDGSTTVNSIPYFVDFIISGIALSQEPVPNLNEINYTGGTYQINAQQYTLALPGVIICNASDPVFDRIDLIYLDTLGAINYLPGLAVLNPVVPTLPPNCLKVAEIGVEAGATGSSGYTLTSININNVITSAGFIESQTLRWNAVSGKWVPTGNLNVSNAGQVGIGTFPTSNARLEVNGALELNPMLAPFPTTDKLYNIGGILYWNGIAIGTAGIVIGTVTGSHLYWDGTQWNENTFWNVDNSTFDPTARIHTYTDTDSFGILTSNKLGDSASERGFNWIVNQTLNGFITQMDITTDSGETFFTLDSSDNNLFVTSSIWNSSARNTLKSSSNTTDRSTEILQQNSTINLTASKEVFDITHFSSIGISSNHPVKPFTTISTVKNNNTNTLNVRADNISLTGLNTDYDFITSQDITLGKYETELASLLNTDSITFTLDVFNRKNSLTITDAINTTSEFSQDIVLGVNTLSITNATSNSELTQSPDNFNFTTTDATGVDTEFNAGNVPVAGENGFQFRVNDSLGGNDLYCLMTAQDSVNNKTTFKVNQLDSTNSDFSSLELSTKINQINLLDGVTGNFYETIQTLSNGVVNRAVSTTADSFVKVTPNQINLDSYNAVTPTTYTSLIQTSTGFQLFSGNSNVNLISNIITSNGRINLNGGIIKRQVNTAIARAVVENDWMIVSTAALTVTLPAAPSDGRELVFRSITGTMTINGNGKNIEAAPTTTVTVGNSRTLIFNATLNRWLNI